MVGVVITERRPPATTTTVAAATTTTTMTSSPSTQHQGWIEASSSSTSSSLAIQLMEQRRDSSSPESTPPSAISSPTTLTALHNQFRTSSPAHLMMTGASASASAGMTNMGMPVPATSSSMDYHPSPLLLLTDADDDELSYLDAEEEENRPYSIQVMGFLGSSASSSCYTSKPVQQLASSTTAKSLGRNGLQPASASTIRNEATSTSPGTLESAAVSSPQAHPIRVVARIRPMNTSERQARAVRALYAVVPGDEELIMLEPLVSEHEDGQQQKQQTSRNHKKPLQPTRNQRSPSSPLNHANQQKSSMMSKSTAKTSSSRTFVSSLGGDTDTRRPASTRGSSNKKGRSGNSRKFLAKLKNAWSTPSSSKKSRISGAASSPTAKGTAVAATATLAPQADYNALFDDMPLLVTSSGDTPPTANTNNRVMHQASAQHLQEHIQTPEKRSISDSLTTPPFVLPRSPRSATHVVVKTPASRSSLVVCNKHFHATPENPLPPASLPLVAHTMRHYDLDAVVPPTASQQDVFDTAGLGPAIRQNIFQGYSATVLAYGAKGSGKTFTIAGAHVVPLPPAPPLDAENQEDTAALPTPRCQNLRHGKRTPAKRVAAVEQDDGLMARCLAELFAARDEYYVTRFNPDPPDVSIHLSCLQVCQNELRDLLVDDQNREGWGAPNNKMPRPQSQQPQTPLTVNEHEYGLAVDGLQRVQVESPQQARQLLHHAMQRHEASPAGAHAIYTLTVTIPPTDNSSTSAGSVSLYQSVKECRAKLTLVDLAGHDHYMVDASIQNERGHPDLIALHKVLTALSEHRGYIPYRESKLTWLLKDALGGNCYTVVVACLSPASNQTDQSLCTLRYAESTRSICNLVRPVLVEIPMTPGECAAMRAENRNLKSRLNKMRKNLRTLEQEWLDWIPAKAATTSASKGLLSLQGKMKQAEQEARVARDSSLAVSQTADRWRERFENVLDKSFKSQSTITGNITPNNMSFEKDSSFTTFGDTLIEEEEVTFLNPFMDRDRQLQADARDKQLLQESGDAKQSLSVEVDQLEKKKMTLVEEAEALAKQIDSKRSLLDDLDKEHLEQQTSFMERMMADQRKRNDLENEIARMKAKIRLYSEYNGDPKKDYSFGSIFRVHSGDTYDTKADVELSGTTPEQSQQQSLPSSLHIAEEKKDDTDPRIHNLMRQLNDERERRETIAERCSSLSLENAALRKENTRLRSENELLFWQVENPHHHEGEGEEEEEPLEEGAFEQAWNDEVVTALRRIQSEDGAEAVDDPRAASMIGIAGALTALRKTDAVDRIRSPSSAISDAVNPSQSANVEEEQQQQPVHSSGAASVEPPVSSPRHDGDRLSQASSPTRDANQVTADVEDASLHPTVVVVSANAVVSDAFPDDTPAVADAIPLQGAVDAKAEHDGIRSHAEKMLSWADQAIEQRRVSGSNSLCSSNFSSIGTDLRPGEKNVIEFKPKQENAASKPSSSTGRPPKCPSRDSDPQVIISNLDQMSVHNKGSCNCEASMFTGKAEHVDFFLPKLGVSCTCGKNSSVDLQDNADPCALTSILRDWQVHFLRSVGISETTAFVAACSHNRTLLAKQMRRWRKTNKLFSVRTSSCSVALHIWARTCKSVYKAVQEQKAKGFDKIERPSFLNVNLPVDNRTVSSLGFGSIQASMEEI